METASTGSARETTTKDGSANSADKDHHGIISQLMAENSRLIAEKDELVASKVRLWKNMHAVIMAKDQNIKMLLAIRAIGGGEEETLGPYERCELHYEIARLKHRKEELELALRGSEGVEKTCEEPGAAGPCGAPVQPVGNTPFSPKVNLDGRGGDASEQQPARVALNNFSVPRGRFQNLPSSSPLPTGASSGMQGTIGAQMHPFKVLILREATASHEQYVANPSELAPSMITKIRNTFLAMSSNAAFVEFSRIGSPNCVDSALGGMRSLWTLEQPRGFACKRCFNDRQPCLLSGGNHRWLVLPLPPGVRGPGVVWKDEAYYIDPHEDRRSGDFAGTWELTPPWHEAGLQRTQTKGL
ncbi:hypothetical protein Q7P37_011487 [Cladosporium fusiforme]